LRFRKFGTTPIGTVGAWKMEIENSLGGSKLSFEWVTASGKDMGQENSRKKAYKQKLEHLIGVHMSFLSLRGTC